jgi:transposase
VNPGDDELHANRGDDERQHTGGQVDAVLRIKRLIGVASRLMEVPGVGPLLASAFIATIADPTAFKTGRDLAAWIGLVPKQNPLDKGRGSAGQ